MNRIAYDQPPIAQPSEGMPLRIGLFILIFFCYYFVQMPLRELAMFYTLDEFIARYTSFKSAALMGNSFMVFLGQALGVYLICYYTHKRYSVWLTVSLSVLMWMIMTLVRFLFDQVLFQWWFGFQNYNGETSLLYYIADNVYWGGNYCMIGLAIYFIRYALFSERRRSELTIEKRTTELAFLRSQVNPHFLFNTLNNLYALIYAKSDNALKVVEKISGLLRYSLYEVEKTVPVEQELKYVRDFIELERLRYDFPIALELKIADNLAGLRMPPFLFVPFVENAFKHGDLRDFEQPVEIVIQVKEQTLVFRCKNRIKTQQKDRAGGIGLENIQKRLELLYGERHRLQIEDVEGVFSIELRIPI